MLRGCRGLSCMEEGRIQSQNIAQRMHLVSWRDTPQIASPVMALHTVPSPPMGGLAQNDETQSSAEAASALASLASHVAATSTARTGNNSDAAGVWRVVTR